MSLVPTRPRAPAGAPEPSLQPGLRRTRDTLRGAWPARAWALIWSTRADTPLGQALGAGALVWGIYAAVYIVTHGVILDESVVPAQIISGAIHYPPGHPHQVYYTEAYSLGNYLSAAVFQLTQDPWLISALRNWLALFCATFLPFAVTLLLTGAPAWGHVAAALTLTEAAIAFQGEYPLWVFPAMYSTGNTSLHIALLAAVLLLAGGRRLGGLLLGLLPSIHPALALLTWGWTAVFVFLQRSRWPRRQLVTLAGAIGVGLAVCVALGGIVLLQVSRAAATGAPPYVPADIDGELVRRTYVALTDAHRRLFDWPSVAYLLGPTVFAGLSGLLLWSAWRRRRDNLSTTGDGRLGWIVLMGGLAWVAIYSAGLVQATFGSLPDLVGTLMPYRLSNVTALLLIPLAVSGIAVVSVKLADRQSVLWGAVGLLLLALAVRVSLDREAVFRNGLFVILGGFLAADMFGFHRDVRRLCAGAAVLLGLGGLAWKLGLQHEVAYLLASWALISAFLWASGLIPRVRHLPGRPLRAAFATLLALGCVGVTLGASVSLSIWDGANMVYDAVGTPTVRWDAISPYDQALGDWLRLNAEPDALILSAVWPRSELQAKVGHPVLMELETLPLMTYLPSVAGSTGMLAQDLFGVDYSRPDQLVRMGSDGRLNLDDPAWLATWPSRGLAEWQALGRKYAFHLVLAPAQTRLDLPIALPGPAWTLYTIP